MINARFNAAKPGSGRLDEIGVIIHGVDRTEDPTRTWAPCPPGSEQCGFLSDRVSTFVVHRDKTAAFSLEDGGIVLNPEHAVVLCGYGGDGGTRGRTCSPPGANANCVPGCWCSWPSDDCWIGAGDYSDWCDPWSNFAAHGGVDAWCGGKAWKASDLGELLRRDRAMPERVNEIVVDAHVWEARLPDSIDAIIAPSKAEKNGAVEKWYKDFLRRYPTSRAPLLRYRPTSAGAMPINLLSSTGKDGGSDGADAPFVQVHAAEEMRSQEPPVNWGRFVAGATGYGRR